MCKVSFIKKCTKPDQPPKRKVEHCEWWVKAHGDSVVAELAEKDAKRAKNRKAREAAATKHKRLGKELKKHEAESDKSATHSIKHIHPVLTPGDSCVPDEFDKIFLHPLEDDAQMADSKVFYRRCDGSIRDEEGGQMPAGPVRNYEGKVVDKRWGSDDMPRVIGQGGGEGRGSGMAGPGERGVNRSVWGGRMVSGGGAAAEGREVDMKRHLDSVRDMGAEMEQLGRDMRDLGMALHAREKEEKRAKAGQGRGRGREGGREGPAGRGGRREGPAGRGTWC